MTVLKTNFEFLLYFAILPLIVTFLDIIGGHSVALRYKNKAMFFLF